MDIVPDKEEQSSNVIVSEGPEKKGQIHETAIQDDDIVSGHNGKSMYDAVEDDNLKRQLKNRHIAMISIGGVIGTGLFVGTATSYQNGGPLGLWLGYSIMGSIVFGVMVTLGEMIAHLPISGGHIMLARRFVSPEMSFTIGWLYWYNWTIVLPAELSAAAVLIGYWDTAVNNAVWITIFLVVVIGINLGGARAYGEAEFWFASIKVITIVGLIIMGIVLTAGGGPHEGAIGFRYWHNPGAFTQFEGISGHLGQFLGFWAVLIQAAFSYIGTEITAIAAGEAKNPKRNLPRAIKSVYIRIIVFYILGTFIIGLICDPTSPDLTLSAATGAKSPWVIAINQAGIGSLPSVVNAAFLTSACSAASSDLYTSSRALYGLALTGNAPRILTRTNRWGLPYLCIFVGFLFSLLSYMNAGASTAGTVFGWFVNMTSVCGLLTWQGIIFIYLRFRKGAKVQGIDRKARFPFLAPLQPWLSYYAFFMLWLILITNSWEVFLKGKWDTAQFITSYLPIVLYWIFFIGYKVIMRTKFIRYDEMDFETGSRAGIEEPEDPPKNVLEKIWRKIV